MIFISKHVYQGLRINASYRIGGRLHSVNRSCVGWRGNAMIVHHPFTIIYHSIAIGRKRVSSDQIHQMMTLDDVVDDPESSSHSKVTKRRKSIKSIATTADDNDIMQDDAINVTNMDSDIAIKIDSISDVTLDVTKSLNSMLLNYKDKHTKSKSTVDNDVEEDNDDDSSDIESIELGNYEDTTVHEYL